MEEWGFSPGDEVELRGLSKLELNGQRGTILALEYPEQARILGRLAVMMQSGKQLSLKVENLFKVPPPKPRSTGGDRGEEWSALLGERGKAMGLPLRSGLSFRALEVATRDLVVMTLNLHHLLSFPSDERLGRTRLREITSALPPPDVVCVQEGLEGSDLLSQIGYTKLISSAVKAQPVREMLYGHPGAVAAVPASPREKLSVNELYIRAQGTEWEVVETGVEQVSSDLMLSGGDAGVSGPLAVRSVVWARLRPKSSPEGPFIMVLNTQISGGGFEDQFFVRQLAQERHLQIQRILELFDGRASESDLGILVADLQAPPMDTPGEPLHSYFESAITNSGRAREDANTANLRSKEDLEQRFTEYMLAPFAVLKERHWTLAYSQAKVGATSDLGFLADHMATSREVSVSAERVITANQRDEAVPRATDVPLSNHNAVKSVFRVRQKVESFEQRPGLVELPILGFGTCFMPEDMKDRVSDKDYRKKVDELTEECVLAALKAGVRLFDCANKHINQQAVGRTLEEAIRDGLVSRTELFISGRIFRCQDQAEVRREVDMMLRELRVEYVDLLTMEVPPERAPKAWSWLEEVYRLGSARYLGVANFDLLGPKVCVEVFREFLAKVEVPPSVYAMEVHPFNTNDEMSECCKSSGIQIVAFSPLGAPHKIEAFMKVLTKSDAREMRPLLKVTENPTLLERGKEHGVSCAQVALRWNLQRGHCVIPKSFDRAHVAENTELFHFRLTDEDMSFVSGLHKGVRAERFFQQAYATGHRALPKMTRDAQDDCAAILAKMRGRPTEAGFGKGGKGYPQAGLSLGGPGGKGVPPSFPWADGRGGKGDSSGFPSGHYPIGKSTPSFG